MKMTLVHTAHGQFPIFRGPSCQK